jgi:hypothetical protein
MTHISMTLLSALLVAIPCSSQALVHIRLVEELRSMNTPRPGDATLVLRIDAKSDNGPAVMSSMQAALILSNSFAGRILNFSSQSLLFDIQDYNETSTYDSTRMALLWIYTYDSGVLRSIDTGYTPIIRIVIEYSMVQLAGCLEWSDGVPEWYTADAAMTVLTGDREAIPAGLQNLPMPVEFESMTAVCEHNLIHLKWSTATEANNAGFIVQRSMEYPHTRWHTRGYVPGAGSSSVPRTYDFRDAVADCVDRLWYRLVQIDRDGTEHDLPVVEVEPKRANAMSILPPYPNPFNHSFTVIFQSQGDDAAVVDMHDAAGRLVMTQRLTSMNYGLNRFTLPVPDVATGKYMYRIRSGNSSRSGWLMKR